MPRRARRMREALAEAKAMQKDIERYKRDASKAEAKLDRKEDERRRQRIAWRRCARMARPPRTNSRQRSVTCGCQKEFAEPKKIEEAEGKLLEMNEKIEVAEKKEEGQEKVEALEKVTVELTKQLEETRPTSRRGPRARPTRTRAPSRWSCLRRCVTARLRLTPRRRPSTSSRSCSSLYFRVWDGVCMVHVKVILTRRSASSPSAPQTVPEALHLGACLGLVLRNQGCTRSNHLPTL